MEWDPIQNCFVRIENAIHGTFLQTLNFQLEQYETEQVNYDHYLNHIMSEYDQNQLKELNSKIMFFESSYDQITSKFLNLDEIPNHFFFIIKRILKFRSINNLFPNNIKNDNVAYMQYIINIANILSYINQN